MYISYILLFISTIINQSIERQLTEKTAQQIEHTIVLIDSLTPGKISNTSNLYTSQNGNYTFRQNPHRRPACVAVELDEIRDITLDWTFNTASDTTRTDYGIWYGGTGWTGQPLYVKWDEEQIAQFKQQSPALTADFSSQEIIVGSLCGMVYFIDFQSGRISRQPLTVGNTIKGTPSLDPTLNGNLYVGHGIPKQPPFGFSVFDIFTHREIYRQGKDLSAWRGWGAFDSSPVAIGQFLFWPGENGSLYKFTRQHTGLRPHSILRYKVENSASLGIENSLAICGELGYLGDNGGNIICVNLSTLRPVWHYDNHDDIDATIVVDTTDRLQPSIYTACEVDKQGDEGFSYLTKLNAITGKKIWEHKEVCYKIIFPNRKLDGGVFATPLLGSADCADLIFVNYAVNSKSTQGKIVAIDKGTGTVVFEVQTDNYLWSSPVSVCDKKGRMYIITGDTSGNLYLIEGRTGRVVVKKQVGQNFESSPIIVDQSIVVGSRGQSIYKLSLR